MRFNSYRNFELYAGAQASSALLQNDVRKSCVCRYETKQWIQVIIPVPGTELGTPVRMAVHSKRNTHKAFSNCYSSFLTTTRHGLTETIVDYQSIKILAACRTIFAAILWSMDSSKYCAMMSSAASQKIPSLI